MNSNGIKTYLLTSISVWQSSMHFLAELLLLFFSMTDWSMSAPLTLLFRKQTPNFITVATLTIKKDYLTRS